MNEFQEKIANCYLGNHANYEDNTPVLLEDRLDVILDRIHFYGNALIMENEASPSWKGRSLETLGMTLMEEAKAAKLIIDEFREGNSN